MRLSIVVNMYNTAKYMPRCMETLMAQDIPQEEYEIILVDDGSTDNSLSLAQEYVHRFEIGDLRLKISVIHQENKGLAAARNTGIDAAKGQYLCFVDPDDYIVKNSLAALLKQMDDEQLDMLRFNYQKVDENYNNVPDSEIEARFDYTPGVMTGTEFLAHRLGVGCYVWVYIYRLDFVKGTGIRFFEGCFFDDTPWLPRVLQKAQRVNVNPVRHQYYLQRTGSMVHSHNKEAVMRKVDMQMQMIDILMEQKQSAPAETYGWYDMMFAHFATSLLTSIACVDYRKCSSYYIRLKERGIFPLSKNRASKKSIRKINILNFCPRLLFLLIHVKNH